jgi:hypothetical protein
MSSHTFQEVVKLNSCLRKKIKKLKLRDKVCYYLHITSDDDYAYVNAENTLNFDKVAAGMKVGETRYFTEDGIEEDNDDGEAYIRITLHQTTEERWSIIQDISIDCDDLKHTNDVYINGNPLNKPKISFYKSQIDDDEEEDDNDESDTE